MKRKYCTNCHEDTWHNPLKNDGEKNGYRCTACGSPIRAGKKHVTRKDIFRDGRMQPTVVCVGGS